MCEHGVNAGPQTLQSNPDRPAEPRMAMARRRSSSSWSAYLVAAFLLFTLFPRAPAACM